MSTSAAPVSVNLIFEEPTGVDRKNDLLLGGLPLQKGVLKQGGFFNLRDEHGKAKAVEGTPAAFWPDGSVKWLHICGLLDLAGAKRNSFHLELQRQPAPQGLIIEESRTMNDGPMGLRIAGGELSVEVTPHRLNILGIRYAGVSQLINPGLSLRLSLVAPDGSNRRTLDWQPCSKKPDIAAHTANRVVLRLPGRFIKPSGEDAAELILFVEIFREAPEVRFEVVFIPLVSPDEDLIAGLSMTVHTPISGEDSAWGFANQKGRGFWDVIRRIKNDERGGDGPRWPQARQTQLGSSFFVTEKRTGADSSWTKCVEGLRAMGWCHLSGRRRHITAAMRYFWQEYPRSLAIDADAGTITFGLIPPEARPLDLRRYSPNIFGAAMYEASEGPFPATHGAVGIAKTSELMLRFDAKGAQDAPERGLFFTQPIRIMSEPTHFAASSVLGRIVPAPAEGFEKVEAILARVADFMVNERDFRGWYGLMNYGDIMSSYYSDLDRWAFDDGGYAWINTESRPDYGLWLQSLRCARADWLEAAIAMTRHNRDVDMYHRGLLKGSGSRHNVNHWGCQDKEWRISQPMSQRLHYYLTADPWTREVMRETIAVYRSYTRTASIGASMMAAFYGILTAWELEHLPADEQALDEFANVIASAVNKDGLLTEQLHVNLTTGQGHPVGDKIFTSLFFFNTFGGQHALTEYVELTGHPSLAAALERYAGYLAADKENLPETDHTYRSAMTTMVFLAQAFRRTKNERFKKAIQSVLPNADETPQSPHCSEKHYDWLTMQEIGGDGILEEPRHQHLVFAKRRNKIACSLGDLLHQIPFGLAAFEKTCLPT